MVQQVTHAQSFNFINNGDIMYVKDFTHISARIIQFVTRSKYSHCGILFWVTTPFGQKRLMIVEAQGGTTRRIQDFDFYCKRELDIVAAPVDFASVANVALAHIGEAKYGYFEAFYTGLRDFFWKYTGLKLPKKDLSGEICSEFVARVYGQAADSVSPQDLFDEMKLPVNLSVVG